jgi:hypothetical protein
MDRSMKELCKERSYPGFMCPDSWLTLRYHPIPWKGKVLFTAIDPLPDHDLRHLEMELKTISVLGVAEGLVEN